MHGVADSCGPAENLAFPAMGLLRKDADILAAVAADAGIDLGALGHATTAMLSRVDPTEGRTLAPFGPPKG
ncbi:hypothetical protein [Frankia gtarii]|uniref:hypothetical protein n=1 Tax=Frankia gtarii TaxID=2950102 RepID=UPI0021C1DA29|nr:hypothetical protein [Frankia gtarii]